MEEVVLFLMTFLLLFLIYEILLIRPLKKKGYQKSNKKELMEVRYLISKYHLNMDKISYSQLLQLCAITSCLNISITVTVVSYVSSFLWEIIVGFVVIFLLIYGSYYLIYLFYKKKGMIRDGKHQ